MPSKMHSNRRPTFGSLAVKTLSAAVASAALFSSAYAAGLGKLTVLSSLGQPLRAEIELTSISADEQGALVAKLASPETFTQANIDFNPVLLSLRFAIEQRGQRQFIRMTSAQPLNEPFVDMLLELTGPNGRLVREYTFLLDPADLRALQPAQVVSAPAPEQNVVRPQQQIAPAARQAGAQADAVAASQRPVESASELPDEYRVRNGDSLWQIANQLKPSDVSLDQMLVALYQANPAAFTGKNMNRLKAGQILSVPDASTASSINSAEAHGMIVAQAADFDAYRRKLAGQVAATTPQQSEESRQIAGGKITAQVEERSTPANESKDKLTLSSSSATANDSAATGPSVEDLIARDKALAEANARVQELEKNVRELQKLLEIQSQGLAEQQSQSEGAEAKTSAAKPASEQQEAVPEDAVNPPVVTPQPEPESKPASKPALKPAPVAPPVETSFIDDLLANPLTWPGVGALLVALGGLGIYRSRRQKRSKSFEDSIITDSSLKANSLFGSTGGQSVDTNNSIFNSSFATSANQLDSNEVDPVAEADVYIAYGRDAQAEEILKEAMRMQPDRHAIRVKLLEIYSNRKDLRAFEVLATELYGLTNGEGDEWKEAAAMGAAIDPNNPLYAGGDGRGTASSKLVAPTQPLNEQGLATLLSVTQSDTTQGEAASLLETDTSYFSNTAIATERPFQPPVEVEATPEKEPTKPEAMSNEMDFDLDGTDLSDDLMVPNTIPRPDLAEPPAELASIDFDFLGGKAVDAPVTGASTGQAGDIAPDLETAAESQASESQASESPSMMEFSLDSALAETPPVIDAPVVEQPSTEDVAPIELEVPRLDAEIPEASTRADSASADSGAEPMDFDLSEISLELDSADMDATTDFSEAGGDAANSEMATKLDLAIAYQEIGDKEGARELLDEVLKGGTAEQSEKAKSLLLELA